MSNGCLYTVCSYLARLCTEVQRGQQLTVSTVYDVVCVCVVCVWDVWEFAIWVACLAVLK